MNTSIPHTSSQFRRVAVLAVAVAMAIAAYAVPQAQTPVKKALTIDDYTRWRAIVGQQISGDGKWVAYTLQLTNVVPAESKPVLHLLNLETNEDVTVADATGATFSPDSLWVAYHVDPAAAQRGRGGRGGSGGTGTPATPPRRVELRNLSTGAVRSWQEIGTFAFSATSTHLYLRRRGGEAPSEGGRRGGGGAPPAQPPAATGQTAAAPGAATASRGQDTVLLDLRSGRYQSLGNVADIAFNRTGELLAYTVDAAVKDVNGLFVFDTRSGRTTVFDSDAKRYNRLAWNDDGTALAVLRGSDVEKMREKDNELLAFSDVASALKDGAAAPVPVVLDPAKAEGFPKGWVVSDRAGLSWSEDGKRVFFGMKEQAASVDTTTRRSTDEVADVDVWNTADDRVQSLQMNRANQDRNFTFREAFDVSARRFVKLADESMRELEVAPDGTWAVGRDARAYLRDETKLPAADFYRVNTTTGERALIAKGQLTGAHVFGIAPNGACFLYWKDSKFQAYDLNGQHDAGAGRRRGAEFRRCRVRPSGHEAVVRRRRLRERRQGGHRQRPVRPVAAAARRFGGDQPDRRARHEERDQVPPCSDHAA